MFLLVLLFLLAVGLTAIPVALPAFVPSIKIGMIASAIMTGSGVLLLALVGVVMIITRLYVKTKASEAFVRTGWGGMKIIKDGGAIVIPVIHSLVFLSLKTIRLDVARVGKEALITNDKLRADINAEFFVHIDADDTSIQAAARSLGSDATQAGIESLVIEKLISALRSVAATKTLEELNSDRESFLKLVMENVHADLKFNGLTLESVTISRLDQTDTVNLNDTNIFDAQGLQTIAQITQAARVKKNQIEREAEQQRKAQDVETAKRLLTMEQEQKQAQAEQLTALAQVAAHQEQVSQEAAIAARRSVQIATIEQERTLEVAAFEKQQAVEVADRQRQQAVEVAERAKLQAIAVADAQKAIADANCAAEEAKAESARQATKTVTVVAEADRKRQTLIIDAEADAKKKLLLAQQEAEAKAFSIERDAAARKTAADADATAITKRADAQATATTREAEGQRAQQMVAVDVAARQVEVDKQRGMIPVDVGKAQVDIEQRRVEVLTQELKARQENGEVAQKYELEKLQITMQAQVEIKRAESMATLLGRVDAQVFGTPEDAARMMDRFASGMGFGNLVSGLQETLDPKVMQIIKSVAGNIGDIATSLASGSKIEPPVKPPSEG
jgi:flotillin